MFSGVCVCCGASMHIDGRIYAFWWSSVHGSAYFVYGQQCEQGQSICFEVNVGVLEQMLVGILEHVFTLYNHHKECGFCEV